MAKYADVIIDISRGQLDKSFQYRIPAELEDRIRVGSRVRVSFGSDRRKIRGYVIGISEKAKLEEAKIRPIDGTVRDAIDIESQLISLAVWMKDHFKPGLEDGPAHQGQGGRQREEEPATASSPGGGQR